ncbi:DHH family protein [Helicobacter pylori]|nr:DHH family protein [Helicobacter pylori]
MPKKELLKMSKKRIFKDFFKEVQQHRPIVFYTDNDCDGMLWVLKISFSLAP